MRQFEEVWTIAIDRTKRRKTDIDDEGGHPANRWIRERRISATSSDKSVAISSLYEFDGVQRSCIVRVMYAMASV